ncbi:Uncharacterised protein [Sebaldella termitidis]|uniref:Uncharacterized protein n=1 Tax=Sebaldella termitidis (strain ATCC 33386 / NCTC 11300) TaxID=526218 RepID=D1AMT1_SEBTE|nr:hypothetical protein [Sebaldella termitidis]ACZ07307.1 hypothetical protein Sterm_0426 [Sebaldella termitidis ATCC 33386]SUI22600.1 Uncharacterised protein [Sebaldella termitidis]
MNVFKLKKFTRSDFNYFNNLNLMSEVSLVSACLNEFSFRTEEEKRGEIVVYLELFMCTEHTGEFLKYHYDELEKIIKKYETIDNKYFSDFENEEIKSMLKKYRDRVKDMDITEVTENGEYRIYSVKENNELELKFNKLRVLE